MTEKELKKLSRMDLLELMLKMSDEMTVLRRDLRKAKKQAASKRILIRESGSIAEATVKISELFDHAQETADVYIQNIKDLQRREEEKLQELENSLQEERESLEQERAKLAEERLQFETECKAEREKLAEERLQFETERKAEREKLAEERLQFETERKEEQLQFETKIRVERENLEEERS